MLRLEDLKNKVFHGDCLEVMQTFPDKSFDAIICDLPFNTTQNKWDVLIPFEPLWEQYKRVIKRGGYMSIFSNSFRQDSRGEQFKNAKI